MRKQVLAVTIGVLLVLSVFSVLQFWQINPAEAAVLFQNGFEEGQFNPSPGAWTSNFTESPSTVAVTSTTKYAGSYAANLTTVPNIHPCNISKTLSATGDLYYGFEFQANALPPSTDDYLHIASVGTSLGYATKNAFVRWYHNDSAVIWQLGIYTNGADTYLINSTLSPSINTWYWVELYVHPASSSGGAALYIEDNLVASSFLYATTVYLTPTYCQMEAECFGTTTKCLYDNAAASTTYVYEEGTGDSYPTFSVQSPSTTTVSTSCLFACLISDDVQVNCSIFGTNNTGSWVNETAVAVSAVSGWVNVTKTLNDTVGNLVQFRWWANDSSGQWGNSSMQNLMVVAGTYYLTINSLNVAVSYTINGTVSGASVTASSGSAAAIQTAVDAVVAAGGIGTVHVPAGTWNFTNTGVWSTVNVTAGVSIIGASNSQYGNGSNIAWSTKLIQIWNVPSGDLVPSYIYRTWFKVTGSTYPSRISDLELVGYGSYNTAFNSTIYYLAGVDLTNCIDFRIDHMNFSDIRSGGVRILTSAANNPTRGVIDHCLLINTGNPYPGYGTNPFLVGYNDYAHRTVDYGIMPYGSASNTAAMWDSNITNVLGHYTNYTTFIEDCVFAQWRHCVSSINGMSFVFRHNIVYGDNQGSVDGHGTYTNIGTRSMEIYNNTFIVSDYTYEAQPNPVNVRGGGGVYFNNTVNGWYFQMMTVQEGSYSAGWPGSSDCPWNAWGNTANNSATLELGLGIVTTSQRSGYVAYAYPHPLTLVGSSGLTNATIAADVGTYLITVPSQVSSDGSTYDFVQWQDSSTNTTITIVISANTTITATFIEVSSISITRLAPSNITYDYATIPISFTAEGGTIAQRWCNFKNGSSWVYAENQTIVGATYFSGFINGTQYTAYLWANNTIGETAEATVMFSVQIPIQPTGGTNTLIINVWWSGYW